MALLARIVEIREAGAVDGSCMDDQDSRQQPWVASLRRLVSFAPPATVAAFALLACSPDDETPADGKHTDGGADTDTAETDDTDDTGDTHDTDYSGGGGTDSGAAPVQQPAGDWIQVVVGVQFTCGLHADGTSECWGVDTLGQLDVPESVFVSIGAQGSRTCGLHPDGTIECWGAWSHDASNQVPSGSWAQLSCGCNGCAALDADGRLSWWGWDQLNTQNPPSGPFTAAVYGCGCCVISEAGAVDCWMPNWSPDRPDLAYEVTTSGAAQVAIMDRYSGCWLDELGMPTCWGGAEGTTIRMPTGVPFSQIAGWDQNGCAVGLDGALYCWGDRADDDPAPLTDSPPGLFVQVSVKHRHACAVNVYGGIECWGYEWYGENTPPQ